MSDELQQIYKSLKVIEEQLALIYQAIGSNPKSASEGVIGIFDGEFMVSQDGKKHQIPPNYASKSMLVAGDTIKMVEDPDGGPTKFKQIDKVERVKLEGVLAKKDGKYEVLTEVGSFKVLPVAVKHYNGESGDQVKIQIPRQHAKGGWAAFEKVVSSNQPDLSEIPQVLMNPAASSDSSESAALPQRNTEKEKGAAEMPKKDDQASKRPEEKAQSSGGKSKSRKKKKKGSDASGPNQPSNNSNNNTPSATTPASNVTSTPELVEIAFDDDDLV